MTTAERPKPLRSQLVMPANLGFGDAELSLPRIPMPVRIDPESGLEEDLIDDVMRALYQARSESPHEMTDERWARTKRRFSSMMFMLREDAIAMLESGEWS